MINYQHPSEHKRAVNRESTILLPRGYPPGFDHAYSVRTRYVNDHAAPRQTRLQTIQNPRAVIPWIIPTCIPNGICWVGNQRFTMSEYHAVIEFRTGWTTRKHTVNVRKVPLGKSMVYYGWYTVW
jgi:hypothetical protein